ncbi:MAG: hypothetical protein HeimC3_09960 [Candidatus Heimdallarchaeota archaeon LC_3]|nr:MAG: hypothetical protein HeimC3_09960 [Candidatus Heimdallarchaeota archaeon LC_3]
MNDMFDRENVQNVLTNPLVVFFFLTAIANQGIIIQLSFFFFQSNDIPLYTFSFMFLGLILAYIFILIFGFNPNSKKTMNILIIFSIIHSILILALNLIFSTDVNLTIINYLVIGFFGGYLSLFTLVRALRTATDENRIRTASKIFFIWFLGQSIFGSIFIISVESALILALISSVIGIYGLVLLLRKDFDNKDQTYQRITILEIITPNNLSLIILFSIYGLILFSYIKIYSDTIFPPDYHSSITASILIGIIITTFTSIVIYGINRKVSLKSTYSIIYIVVSISLILLLFDMNNIEIVFFLSVSVWSFFGTLIFTTIGDIYPKSQYLQLIAFWWLALTVAFGGGILLPIIITNTTHLLNLNLFLVLFSIFLLTYLSSVTTPLMVYHLIVFTPTGMPVYSRGYLEINQALVTGLLSGIMTMFKEVFDIDSESNLKSIDHGDKKLLISKTDNLIGVLLINHVESLAVDKLKEITEMFEVTFHQTLEKEPHNMAAFRELPPLLESKLNFFQKN